MTDKILLIENTLENAETLYNSVNNETFPIIYSLITTKSEILEILQNNFKTINKIIFAFQPISGNVKYFLDNQPLFSSEKNENVDFIISIIKFFQVKELDFLSIELLKQKNWISYFNLLKKETGVTINRNSLKNNLLKTFNTPRYLNSGTFDDKYPLIFFSSTPQYLVIRKDFIYVSLSNDRIAEVSISNPNNINENYIVLPNGYDPKGIVIYNNYLYIASGNGSGFIGRYTFNKIGDSEWIKVPGYNLFEGLVCNGSLFVSVKNLNTIIKINISQKIVNQNYITGLNNPKGLYIYNDYIYVCNNGNNCISKFNLYLPKDDFNLIWYNFNSLKPETIFINRNFIYVTLNIGYIAKLDFNLMNVNLRWRNIGSPYGCFGNYSDLFVINQSEKYLVRHRFYIDPMEIYTETGFVPLFLKQKENYIYIINYGTNDNNCSVSKINITNASDKNNNFIPFNYIEGRPLSVELNDTHLFIYTSYGVIGRYDINNPLDNYEKKWVIGLVPGCNDIIFDSNGSDLYLTDYFNNSINKINDINSRDTNLINYVNITFGFIIVGNNPSGLVINNGYMYVSDSLDKKIGKYLLSNPNSIYSNPNWFIFDNNNYPNGISILNDFMFVSLKEYQSDYISKISLIDQTNYRTDWLPVGGNCWGNLIYKTPVFDQPSPINGYIFVTDNVNNLLYKQPLYVDGHICFVKGTPVLTDQGIIDINKINPKEHTIRGEKIFDIIIITSADKELVCFEKDAFNTNIPSDTVIVSKNHKIELDGVMTLAIDIFKKKKNNKIYLINKPYEILYNILLEKLSWVNINNLICETLNPNEYNAKMFSNQSKYLPEQREEIINLINKDSKKIKNKMLEFDKVLSLI
jgi:hypothetical protein